MSLPPPYPELLEITRRMLAAAQAHDWDTLTALDKARAPLVARLPERLPALAASDVTPLAATLREILAAHEEITALAAPWLKHTGQLLQSLAGAAAQSAESATTSRDAPG